MACMRIKRVLACLLLWLPALAGHSQEPRIPPLVSDEMFEALQADLDNGTTIYDNACASCHGEFGQGGQNGGPALSRDLNLNEVMEAVIVGSNNMPAFNVLTTQELLDIGTFVVERLYR